MKICILSDSHDNRPMLLAAIKDAKLRGAQAVLHCGDVIAPSTLRGLNEIGLPLHVIHGNNAGDVFAMHALSSQPENLISYYGQDTSLELCNRKIFLVHYPHYANALACTGDWDIVCFGHNHRAEIIHKQHIKGGKTWLVNPGSVGGLDAPPTYVLGDLQKMEFVIYPVSSSQ